MIKYLKKCAVKAYIEIGTTLFPKRFANIFYRGAMGKNIDWKNPMDLNEKINWMKFNYDTSIWSRLADKYLVREYVEERGLSNILVKLYGVWSNANDIDFDKLPNQFVLKTNHGCGTIIVVEDKSKLDISSVRKTLNKWLKVRFGRNTVEPHYLKIQPLIIAEELLINDNEASSSLVDYKVFCLNGSPYSILVCANRGNGHVDKGFYDVAWNFMPQMSDCQNIDNMPRPQKLQEMIDSSVILSKGHPQVRVDFYEVQGCLYFGEMTFTSLGGYMNYITPSKLIEMGNLVKLG